MADEVADRFGRTDVLVNNAGITPRRSVMDVSAYNYDLVTGVVLRGTLHMSQAVIPHMRTRGSGAIVCMSSMSAQQGGGVLGGTHYCAAKAGVIGMAKALPLRRTGRPVDITGACLYLASDLAAIPTGTTLDVDGGAHIR